MDNCNKCSAKFKTSLKPIKHMAEYRESNKKDNNISTHIIQNYFVQAIRWYKFASGVVSVKHISLKKGRRNKNGKMFKLQFKLNGTI